MSQGVASFWVYILRCSDGSYYTGMTSDLALRIVEHEQGLEARAYTYSRRPVVLVWSHVFPTHDEAFRAERQIKGWRRLKKEALIRGDFESLQRLARSARVPAR